MSSLCIRRVTHRLSAMLLRSQKVHVTHRSTGMVELKFHGQSSWRSDSATVCWMQGGFAGLMLRLKADGHDKIDLYGPPGLLWLLSTRHLGRLLPAAIRMPVTCSVAATLCITCKVI